MVKISDIYRAVCSLLLNETDITVEDSDLNEPMIRPSFRVLMNTVKTSLYSAALRELKVYINIYYYATDRKHSKAEIFDIENMLSFMFLEPFKIKDGCSVYIEEVNFEKVEDGILNCNFSFEIATEYIDESDLEAMEELNMDVYMGELESAIDGEFEVNVYEEDEEDGD